MYILKTVDKKGTMDFWGPFPSEGRANKYAEMLHEGMKFCEKSSCEILPIIVPNACVIKYNY